MVCTQIVDLLANKGKAKVSEAVLANRRVPKGPAVLRSNTLICSKSVAKVRKTGGFASRRPYKPVAATLTLALLKFAQLRLQTFGLRTNP